MANCFVIMPFRPELTYFYKYIKQHFKEVFPDVTFERGDDQFLAKPILEKIEDYIEKADFLIADCSGRNPNVFYELGMAHAWGKRVILLTGDAIEAAPTDIRAFEFISYANQEPESFLRKIDQAIRNIVGNPFAGLYPEATELFERFRQTKDPGLNAISEAEFEDAMSVMHAGGQRLPREGRARAEFLLRRLLGVEPEIEILIALKSWLEQVFPG